MLLRCLLKRPGGSIINIDGVDYKFTPSDSGDHTCEVDNPAHLAMLFAVEKDGFERVSDIDAGTQFDKIQEYMKLTGKRPDGRWTDARLADEINKLNNLHNL